MSKIIMFFIYGWHETENINEDNAMTTFQIKKYDLLVRDQLVKLFCLLKLHRLCNGSNLLASLMHIKRQKALHHFFVG